MIRGKVCSSARLTNIVTTIADLIVTIYRGVQNKHMKSMDWICECSIPTPQNNTVVAINDMRFKSFEMEYKYVDSVLQIDEAVHYPVKFLNSVNPPGLPYHKLHLKVVTGLYLHKNLIQATVFNICARREYLF